MYAHYTFHIELISPVLRQFSQFLKIIKIKKLIVYDRQNIIEYNQSFELEGRTENDSQTGFFNGRICLQRTTVHDQEYLFYLDQDRKPKIISGITPKPQLIEKYSFLDCIIN